MISKNFPKNEYDLNITGADISSVVAFGNIEEVIYRGVKHYRLTFNTVVSFSVDKTAISLTLVGATFKSGLNQGIVLSTDDGSNIRYVFRAYAQGGFSTLYGEFSGGVRTFLMSGSVLLDKKPDWYKG